MLATLSIASDLIGNYYSLDNNIIGSFITQNTWEICQLKCDLGDDPELATCNPVCLSSPVNCVWKLFSGQN